MEWVMMEARVETARASKGPRRQFQPDLLHINASRFPKQDILRWISSLQGSYQFPFASGLFQITHTQTWNLNKQVIK